MNQDKTIPVIVQWIHQETAHVKRFSLAPVGNEPLPYFSGGSHITTYVEGENETIIRSYSLTNSPQQSDTYHIAIRLHEQSKGGSRFWHERMKVGDTLRISHPQNHFPLSFKAKHHVFYAAGIGITPFLSMMAELKGEERSFELHYAAKSEKDCSFYSHLKNKYPEETHFYFSNEKRLNDESLWEHRIGTHVYFCGPSSFMDEFIASATNIGYPRSSIHYERFTPPQSIVRHDFLVELESGPTIQVTQDMTLLEALHNAGIKAPYSCRVGRCGTCEINVLEGEVEHGDSFLSEKERNEHRSILTCVSRAKTKRLRIEL
ncbi:PDR/VanB family oxidoreductase [Rossellomorea aquimaris]|uniref:PDR/VanB family oxidoreductase n=1 Tax=Rossellomorea aquimaris TaxID=189382 RepID=UPI001CD2D77E|nr:PDR/VanB family oxidoreductase [Rossellomorea aquimaris]MCA1060678.1 PDR/VanB family oxidoreductase [Rossellomorea aquimaris]